MKWWLISKKTVRRKRISFWIKTLFKTRSIKKYVQSIQPDYAITNTIIMPYLALACKDLALEHVWFIHEIPETWKERKFIWDEGFDSNKGQMELLHAVKKSPKQKKIFYAIW